MTLRVITASSTYDLTILATIKEELGVTDSSQNDRLARLIRESSRDCESYCNRVFASERVEETFRSVDGFNAMVLRRYPITAMHSIAIDDETLVDATDFEWDADPQNSGLVYRLCEGRIPWYGREIVVEYTAGFVLLDTLPEDIERACIDQVRAVLFESKRDPKVRSVTIPGVISREFWVGGINGNGAIHPAAAARLDNYVRKSY